MSKEEENPIVGPKELTSRDDFSGVTLKSPRKEDPLDKDKATEWITDKNLEAVLYGKPVYGIIGVLTFLLVLQVFFYDYTTNSFKF